MKDDRACTRELARVRKVIREDKSVLSEGCRALILQDLADKCNEYFDLNGLPRMEVENRNGTYCIRIEFEAERVKLFNVLR